MSKIFEALERAGQGKPADERAAAAPAQAHIPHIPSSSQTPAGGGLNLEGDMVTLHHHLRPLLPAETHATVQFMSAHEGEGTSTVAREFARVSAERFGQRVLLLTAGALADNQAPDGASVLAPAGERRPGVLASALPRELTYAARASNPAAAADLRERLRALYDLVVIDARPASRSPESLSLASQADGVVLVVAAEVTRWPVALRARNDITRSGGRVLGVVFNKRRHYIPAFIYNWL